MIAAGTNSGYAEAMRQCPMGTGRVVSLGTGKRATGFRVYASGAWQ